MIERHNLSHYIGLIIFMMVPGAVIFAEPVELSLDNAVTAALESDQGVQSARYDYLAASAKADAASWRLLPSITLSAGYQKLSYMEPSSFMGMTLPETLTDNFMISANLQYPVFAGFGIRESIEITRLQSTGKELSFEMIQSALVFETRRAYWETLRARQNRELLEKNLELTRKKAVIVQDRLKQGAATDADLMAVNMTISRAQIDLENATSQRARAQLTLATLTGADVGTLDTKNADSLYILTTSPDTPLPAKLQEDIDEVSLVVHALASRPETRLSDISVETADHLKRLSEAPLYPTLSLSGNYIYADPNSRSAFQTDPYLFTGTWALGIQLSYDLGGLSANLSEESAAEKMIEKANSDKQKVRSTIILDVHNCLLTFNRIREGLGHMKQIVAQAEENLRIVNRQYTAGSVTSLDVLSAELALLKARFAVTNMEIDLQISAADLQRAAALESY